MLEQILARIKHKGWKAYVIEAVERATNKAVEHGPALSLQLGRLYVLFPKVTDPTSIKQINEALRRLEAEPPYPCLDSLCPALGPN